jgi:hypothetical protein
MSRFFNPSMGVACLALAVALSGTAYAVTRLPANSVGTKQVVNHSLQQVDLRRGTLLRGLTGQRGPTGLTGPPGRSGIAMTVNVSKTAPISGTPGTVSTAIANCPAGSILLGGGFLATVAADLRSSFLLSNTWQVSVSSTGNPGLVYAYARCAIT